MSFGWMGIFREGAWKAFRSFVLHEKRDAPKRLRVIDAELERIGQVIVVFERQQRDNDEVVRTERRVGFTVSPNSSLEKLMQAYIAQGGNPFDISLFLQPDRQLVLQEGEVIETEENYPYGGYLSPRSVNLAQRSSFDAGYLDINKYLPSRLGGRQVVWDKANLVAPAIDKTRRWVRQEIKTKRNRIEQRIIKLMDLREQLLLEREELIEQAVGGTISGVEFREEFHAANQRIQVIINGFDEIFYERDDSGRLSFDLVSEARVTGRYQTLLNDLENGEEDWTAL